MNFARILLLTIVIGGMGSLILARCIVERSSLHRYIVETGSNIRNSKTYSDLEGEQLDEINLALDNDRQYFKVALRDARATFRL